MERGDESPDFSAGNKRGRGLELVGGGKEMLNRIIITGGWDGGCGWKTAAKWAANAWALSLGLDTHMPRGVRKT
jgi:hypothetical protein